MRGFQKGDVGVGGLFCSQLSDAQLIPRLRIARISLIGAAEFQRRTSIVLLIEIFFAPREKPGFFRSRIPAASAKKHTNNDYEENLALHWQGPRVF